ncbi:hypothetical protein PF008_g7672 [Phytophthora fragariae]|uniref:Secreted protein n=1 Tax=Phytophthora fragariae TaxID=53985 RepID=A0A6G0S220_9STRA|nr:hypothetical protein PF008_g7672 [Phytophthora fragariae]
MLRAWPSLALAGGLFVAAVFAGGRDYRFSGFSCSAQPYRGQYCPSWCRARGDCGGNSLLATWTGNGRVTGAWDQLRQRESG